MRGNGNKDYAWHETWARQTERPALYRTNAPIHHICAVLSPARLGPEHAGQAASCFKIEPLKRKCSGEALIGQPDAAGKAVRWERVFNERGATDIRFLSTAVPASLLLP